MHGQMGTAATEREMTGTRGVESTLNATGGRPDTQFSPNKQGKQTKKNKNKNRGTGGRNMGLTTLAENDGTLRQKSTLEDKGESSKNNSIKLLTRAATSQHGDGHQSEHVGAGKDSKNYLSKPPTQGASFMHGEGQLRIESGLGGQNESMDMMKGSGKHSPITEQSVSQTKILADNNRVALTVECSRERMKYYAENPPNLESASGKCMYNKELSDVPFIPTVSETNFVEIEVHPRVRRRRHSDIEISIDKIFSLTLDKAVDIRENDEASDEDSISVNFAASWERESSEKYDHKMKHSTLASKANLVDGTRISADEIAFVLYAKEKEVALAGPHFEVLHAHSATKIASFQIMMYHSTYHIE
ncbi:Uncharacterized protein TCM_018721 [Theobroma cacao]|uniref:Uncharacterized protein n=1 Tax=Theobroma cacao TaxID=3641 RepID=A0A061EGW3_THECC|nr:Uncharacterized protein TCM_018721 [Theobroma cacao]